MCYNCGCGNPNDDMGHADNVTNATFDKAATAEQQDPKEARKNTYELLKKEFENIPEPAQAAVI